VRSQPKTAVAMGQAEGFESVKADVVEAKCRHDGSPNFQAELLFTLGQALGNSGRARTMCIRGPYRPNMERAQEDADKLLKTSEQGMQAVREMATTLKRGNVR